MNNKQNHNKQQQPYKTKMIKNARNQPKIDFYTDFFKFKYVKIAYIDL